MAIGTATEREAFELGEDPYWVTEDPSATLIPDAGRLMDRFLPLTLRRPRVRRRLIKQAEELLVRNGENLRWAILRGLDETFRKATARFEERLGATRDVIQDAFRRRRSQSLSLQPELDRLAGAATSLAEIRHELENIQGNPGLRSQKEADPCPPSNSTAG
jgi:hypothetical protein